MSTISIPSNQKNCENICNNNNDLSSIDYESNSSIIEFLNKEQELLNKGDLNKELDIDSIFEEINRLSDNTDQRSVDEILQEAELLLKKQTSISGCGAFDDITKNYNKKLIFDIIEDDSIISQESIPKFLNSTLKCNDNNSSTNDNIDDISQVFEMVNINTNSKKTKCLKKNENKTNLLQKENIISDDTLKNKINCKSSAQILPIPLTKNFKNENHLFKLLSKNEKYFSDKSTNSSPKHYTDAKISPILDNTSVTREYSLKIQINKLQEKLKDTEERLQSLRIQHDSLSQLHRGLRESHTHLQEESELLKLDVQHLNECANVLRAELQSARNDRSEALEIQKTLQSELEESKIEKKKAQNQNEKDTKTIQDLQRQCKEMERILIRKHPDSVSALIVASKNCIKGNKESSGSRNLLEQRIAQLEADAKEQDLKAQKILANVQARFNSVQAKYETHIADLETQVLSLQEINAKLNEKITSEINALSEIRYRKNNLISDFTQTDEVFNKDLQTITSFTQTDFKPVATSSKQIPIKKTTSSKISTSHSDTTISAYHIAAKEDAHLLATIRGMRVDLAIKDKAMQRLTRELDECKKTIKKLQKEKEVMKQEKLISTSSRRNLDSENISDNQVLKEALNKIKLLECDYKTLHEKRLQDLKTLQTAHERELASCNETVRILQERLSERDENFAIQKRRKVPIDYYALKAKVSSLERRHTEREQRLHMLVEALSKSRLNGALEEILNENSQ